MRVGLGTVKALVRNDLETGGNTTSTVLWGRRQHVASWTQRPARAGHATEEA
jgi:hypothetical protein